MLGLVRWGGRGEWLGWWVGSPYVTFTGLPCHVNAALPSMLCRVLYHSSRNLPSPGSLQALPSAAERPQAGDVSFGFRATARSRPLEAHEGQLPVSGWWGWAEGWRLMRAAGFPRVGVGWRRSEWGRVRLCKEMGLGAEHICTRAYRSPCGSRLVRLLGAKV